MRALFIGRFQPVHNGHIHTIKQIMDECDKLVIVIGSAQYSHSPDNPFSGGERVMFLKRALKDEGLPIENIDIIPLGNIDFEILAKEIKSLQHGALSAQKESEHEHTSLRSHVLIIANLIVRDYFRGKL